MNHQMSYVLLNGGVLGGAALVFIGLSLSARLGLAGNLIAALGLAAMLAGIGQALIFYKCPDCGRRLNIRGKKPDFCPGCGRRLDGSSS